MVRPAPRSRSGGRCTRGWRRWGAPSAPPLVGDGARAAASGRRSSGRHLAAHGRLGPAVVADALGDGRRRARRRGSGRPSAARTAARAVTTPIRRAQAPVVEGGQGEVLVVDLQHLRRSAGRAPPGRSAPGSRCRRRPGPAGRRSGAPARASTSQPKPPASTSSLVTQETPPAPRSLKPMVTPSARAIFSTSRLATVSMRFRNGIGRLHAALVLGGRGGVQGGRGEGRAPHARPVGGLAHQDQVVGFVRGLRAARRCG